MKYECPVCKADLIHKRIDDGFDTYRIRKDGTREHTASKSNGSDWVWCSKNEDHYVPQKIIVAVVELV